MKFGTKGLEKRISILETRLEEKDKQLEHADAEYQKLSATLVDDNARRFEELRLQYEEDYHKCIGAANEQIATLQAENDQLKTEREELRKNNARRLSVEKDLTDSHHVINRLMQPITLSDVKKTFKHCEVTGTAAFFLLADEHGITWAFGKGDMMRNSSGYLVNLLQHQEFKALQQSESFRVLLPPGTRFVSDIFFVDLIEEEQDETSHLIYRFVPPCAAKYIMVRLCAPQSDTLTAWCTNHADIVKVNQSHPRDAELCLLFLLLPFPIDCSEIELNAQIDGKHVTRVEIEKQKAEKRTALVNACQKTYLQQFYLTGRCAPDISDEPKKENGTKTEESTHEDPNKDNQK